MSDEKPEIRWWEVPDPGDWPQNCPPPFVGAIRPGVRHRWIDPNFRLRPHP
jgi:hypothetical protein